MGPWLLALVASTSTATSAPRIDLITIGVGDAMYAIYGHAAIRVVEANGKDTAYNFGGVDMKQPNFWSRLMQGQIEAYLEVTPYSQLLLNYSGEDRTIVGRTLAFSPAEAQKLHARLQQIANSAEKNYRYHHFYNNCTTKVAELFDEVKGGALHKQAEQPVPGTHRDWVLDRIRNKPWVFLAMDLAGNGQGDVPITAWDTIYIPEALDRIIDGATFDGRPFVLRSYVDYTSLSHDPRTEHGWPWILVYVFVGLPLVLLGWFFPRLGRGLYGVLAGTIGLVYVGFWLFSDYEFYHRNWNLALFPPTHFLLLLPDGRVLRAHLYGHAALVALVAIGVGTGLIVQALGPMLGLAIPVTAAMLLGHAKGARR